MNDGYYNYKRERRMKEKVRTNQRKSQQQARVYLDNILIMENDKHVYFEKSSEEKFLKEYKKVNY